MQPIAEPGSGVPLGGGVSAEVTLVETAAGPIVVKRALPQLRTAAYWASDPRRSAVEVACLRVLAEVLGDDAVPRVLWADEARHCFAMARLPERLLPWKARLLAGEVDLATARRVGELLGWMHARTAGRAEWAARFDDRTF